MKIVNSHSKTRKIMKNQKKLKQRTNRIVNRVSKREHKLVELSKNKDKKLIKVDIEIISVRLVICVLALVLFYIPYENGFDWNFKLIASIFFVFFIIIYLTLSSMLKECKDYLVISLSYILYIAGWINISVILAEVTFKLGKNIPEKYNILGYTNYYMSLLVLISSVIATFLLPKQTRCDEIMLKKILFINKQVLLLVTILAFFTFKLDLESISNKLIMAALFSIYPLTFIYNFFEFCNTKKNKKEEAFR